MRTDVLALFAFMALIVTAGAVILARAAAQFDELTETEWRERFEPNLPNANGYPEPDFTDYLNPKEPS